MGVLQKLNGICDEIDGQSLCDDGNRSRLPRGLFFACICLLAVHYLKFNYCFVAVLDGISSICADSPQTLRRYLHEQGYLELAGHLWWSFVHVCGYVVLPLLAIRYLLKDSLRDYHLGWGLTRKHCLSYLLLLTPILLFIVLVTVFRDDFAEHYPFYSLAGRSAMDFLLWELAYIVQFIALEFFFRGFILGACKKQMGSQAVYVMMLPYMMIHLPKLWLEASGAILFGLFLGLLALRSRSIWGGVCVHVVIALSMDVAALIKKGAFF